MNSPAQYEVDAVAHFAEAVRELRASPFFIEEYHNLKLSFRQGDPLELVKGGFPDANVVRAMLIPFRRLWQQREPCYYGKVVKILKRYDPSGRGLLDSFVFSDTTAHIRKLPFYGSASLLPSEAIDLWLNTKDFHTGTTAKEGHHTRKDFEKFEKQFGRVLFEYYFLSSVHEVTISFFNLGSSCEFLLKEWDAEGIKPSFSFSLAKPTTDQPQNIERTTPGFTPQAEAPAHRIWRLKRRKRYDAISYFIQRTSFSDEDLAGRIGANEQFETFLADVKITCQKVDDINSLDKEQVAHLSAVSDSFEVACKRKKMRRGTVAVYLNGDIFYSDDALTIISDQYVEFREAFLREPFV